MTHATSQRGLITGHQAQRCGMSRSAIHRRTSGGQWLQVFPGVFRLREVAPSWEQNLLAATLWGGPGAVASHRSAARLWDLGVEDSHVEVTLVRRKPTTEGLTLHVTDTLHRADVTRVDGIPCTTASRTLIDLGAVMPVKDVERALEAALRLRVTSISHVLTRLDAIAAPGRRGVGTIKTILRARDPMLVPTASELESLLWQIFVGHALPVPARQITIEDAGGVIGRVDFAYVQERLVIEAQSARWHLTQQQAQKDMERRNRLTLAKWRVLEITWRDVVRRPGEVARRIRKALSGGAATSRAVG